MTNKVLLSVRDCEEMTGLSHGTVYKLFNQGQLKTVKVGKRRFITQNQLAEFLNDLEAASSGCESLAGVV